MCCVSWHTLHPGIDQAPCQPEPLKMGLKTADLAQLSSYNPGDMSSTLRLRSGQGRVLIRLAGTAVFALGLSGGVAGQQPAARVVTAEDYARAERFITYNTTPLVLHSGVRPTWISGDRFWYRTVTEKGPETFVVDAATGTKTPCELPECKAPHDAA